MTQRHQPSQVQEQQRIGDIATEEYLRRIRELEEETRHIQEEVREGLDNMWSGIARVQPIEVNPFYEPNTDRLVTISDYYELVGNYAKDWDITVDEKQILYIKVSDECDIQELADIINGRRMVTQHVIISYLEKPFSMKLDDKLFELED